MDINGLPLLSMPMGYQSASGYPCHADIHGYPWISMDVRAMYLWISIDLWIPMGFPWMSMDINGYRISIDIFMDLYGYPSISMDIHGHGYPRVFDENKWMCIDFH